MQERAGKTIGNEFGILRSILFIFALLILIEPD